MDNQNNDEAIRDAIVTILHKAYRNPKGKYHYVTHNTLYLEVKRIITCERDDLLRELRFLTVNNVIELKKERNAAHTIYNSKIPASITEHYVLSGKTINNLEEKSKYTTENWVQKSTNIINIKNSTVNAPITNGQQIMISHNPQFDLENITDLVMKNNEVVEKESTIQLLNENLPDLLENPNPDKLKNVIDKLKNIGQQWIVPTITQLVASYFTYKLGMN